MKKYLIVALAALGAAAATPACAQKQASALLNRAVRAVEAGGTQSRAASSVVAHTAAAQRVEASLRHALKKTREVKALRSIRPTPADKLQVNAFRLTPPQRAKLIEKYDKMMTQFAQIKQSWDARMVYWRLEHGFNAMTPLERQTRLRDGLSLATEMHLALEYVFKDDEPLQQAYDYLVKMAETLEPSFHGILARKPLEPRADRAFDSERFFLRQPGESSVRVVEWEDYQFSSGSARDNALALAAQLPKNLRIAVVNDHEGIKTAVEYWAGLGYLGEGAQVSVYKTADLLLSDIAYGRTFDVVATDLQVPGGGGRYLTYMLRKSGSDCPILGLSEYREEDVGAEKLFNLGFDGYIFVDDTFRSYTGYRVFPRALKNYFDMKAQFGWKH